MSDVAFVAVLFLLSLVMLVADTAAWIGWRRAKRSTIQLQEVVDRRYAELAAQKEASRG
jgi:hypothetical protein